MILSDKWIRSQCEGTALPMIEPFTSESKSRLPDGRKVTSHGLSSFGYDLTLGEKFKVLRNKMDIVEVTINNQNVTMPYYQALAQGLCGVSYVDPCDFNPKLMTDVIVEVGQALIIPPRGFVLGVVQEYLRMPNDVMGVCMEKSTIARTAIEVTVTPVEAGWEGYLTLEICNKTDYPARIWPGMGITQLMFFKGDQPCDIPYHKRAGKYNKQPAEPVMARMKD